MILDILNEKCIETNVEAKDWRDAIRKAGNLLLDNGFIEEDYINKMISTVEQFGPYIVLLKGMALAHAIPEHDVKKIGLSIVTLKNPIEFGNEANDPVKVVFGLCALDHASHMELISEMAMLFESDINIESIARCQDPKEILDLIKGIVTKGQN